MGQFCKKCGTPLRDAAKFCPSCGQKVEEADEKKTLVERVRNNDTEAWEELYKKTYPRAYTVAIQTLKNKEDALASDKNMRESMRQTCINAVAPFEKENAVKVMINIYNEILK